MLRNENVTQHVIINDVIFSRRQWSLGILKLLLNCWSSQAAVNWSQKYSKLAKVSQKLVFKISRKVGVVSSREISPTAERLENGQFLSIAFHCSKSTVIFQTEILAVQSPYLWGRASNELVNKLHISCQKMF